jgi:hypothetical protein
LKLLPSKGSAEKFAAKPVRLTDLQIGAERFRDALVIYSDADFKRLLYLDHIRDGKGPWWIAKNTGADYRDEMLKERLVMQKTPRGYEEPTWKRMGANHYADAEKLCLVWWHAR